MAEKSNKIVMSTESVRIRKTPRFLPFLLTGGVLGIIIALVVGLTIPEEQKTGEPIVTLLVAFFAGIGMSAGIVVAIVLDRIGLARAKTLEATKLEA